VLWLSAFEHVDQDNAWRNIGTGQSLYWTFGLGTGTADEQKNQRGRGNPEHKAAVFPSPRGGHQSAPHTP